MRTLTNKETICPKCGKRFKTVKTDEKPNCFYCELKRYPHPDDPDYRDVAAARLNSGTYTKEQNDIYWHDVCKGDPMPQFPGFPEEFDIPKKEMKVELVPLAEIHLPVSTVKELEKFLEEWFKGFLSVSQLVYDEKEDIFIITVPDFIKSSDNPLLWLNLKYVQRFFATIAETIKQKWGSGKEEIRFRVCFPDYPQFNFETLGC